MRATTQFPEATKRERIAVNTKELQAMLGCGRKNRLVPKFKSDGVCFGIPS